MREIKFRAWDKLNKKMVWVLEIEWRHELIERLFVSGDDKANPDDFDIQQYTGLKDKNGKEIYEGDIYRQTWQGKVITGEVIYGDMARFWLRLAPHHLVGEIKVTGEVIGNIYENPELLEARDD